MKPKELTNIFLPMGDQRKLLYGRKVFLEIISHRPEIIEHVLIGTNVSFSPELRAALVWLKEKGVSAEKVERRELDKVSQGANHQGIIAFLRKSKDPLLPDVIEQALRDFHDFQRRRKEEEIAWRGRNGVLIVLDQINDEQNFGSILRVAEAAGVSGVVSTLDHSSRHTPVVRKVSAGASELITLCFVKNLQKSLLELKKSGFWILGSSLGENASSLYDLDCPWPLALVLGSEGRGLRRLTLSLCDSVVKIPMYGKIQSLNVGQAASVLLFEIARRLWEVKPEG